MPVKITKNGQKVIDCNDPSDAIDHFILNEKLPREIFIKREPHTGHSWETLPWRFGWGGNFYTAENAPITTT